VSDQRLPLPVGSSHPIRRGRRAWSARAAASRRAWAALVGMASAGAGAYLGAAPPPVPVGLDAAGYHVASTTYAPRGGGVYTGPGGAVVIAPGAGGGTRAGASTHLDGGPMVGGCRIRAGGSSERCEFELGGRRLGATDRLAPGGWDRRYDDGRTAWIPLEGGRPVPAPFALGR
jgi:hypothetical protein